MASTSLSAPNSLQALQVVGDGGRLLRDRGADSGHVAPLNGRSAISGSPPQARSDNEGALDWDNPAIHCRDSVAWLSTVALLCGFCVCPVIGPGDKFRLSFRPSFRPLYKALLS